MIFEGDMSVIEAIKEKKRLMENRKEHEHIRPLLVIDGGFMKGVYGAGAALAFDELAFLPVFTNFVGISSGAATLAYTLSGQSQLGSTVIIEDCTSRQFLNFWRFKNPEDTAFLQEVLEGCTGKRLETKDLVNRNFYIGLAVFETAKPFLLQPKTREECLVGIRASISMPGAVSDTILLSGVRYVDGASTEPHILKKTYETIDATHVLIITNQDKDTKDILWWDRLITKTIWRSRMSPRLFDVALRRRQIRHTWVDTVLKNPEKPICFVWGNGSIASFERDPEVVKAVIEKSKLWWQELLS